MASVVGPAEYERVKKELFAGRGLNGVYKHRSEPLYAVVYRPTGFNKAALAALAGGVALAGGLGVAYNRYTTPKTPTNSTATHNAGPTVGKTFTQLSKMQADLRIRIDADPGVVISEDIRDIYSNLLEKYLREDYIPETASQMREKCSIETYRNDLHDPDITVQDYENEYVKKEVQKLTEQTRCSYSDVLNNITPRILQRFASMPYSDLVNEIISWRHDARLDFLTKCLDTVAWSTVKLGLAIVNAVESDDFGEFQSLVPKLSHSNLRGLNPEVQKALKKQNPQISKDQQSFKDLTPIIENRTSDSQYLTVLYDALGDAETNKITRDKLMKQHKLLSQTNPRSVVSLYNADKMLKMHGIDANDLKKLILNSDADVRTQGIKELNEKRSQYCELGKPCAYANAMNDLIIQFMRDRNNDALREVYTAKLQHRALLSQDEAQGLQELLDAL